VYLITGGLGRVGSVLAEYLARAVQARLVLTGRTPLPAREEWKTWLSTHGERDEVSLKIRTIQALEEAGATVVPLSADVGSYEEMAQVFATVRERFGALHGVIHAAGVARNEAASVLSTGRALCQVHFRAKGRGLYVLRDLLEGSGVDFCLLMSSTASVLGALGYAAYSAANLFMDAFVHAHNRSSPSLWTSVNWDRWQFGEEGRDAVLGEGVLELALAPAEGVRAFQRILSAGPPAQVVVSTGDLQPRIDRWVRLEGLRGARDGEKAGIAYHPRPDLEGAYVAPRNEREQILAGIWQELLGVERVGIHDGFFELGGDSLIAVQAVARSRQSGIAISLRELVTRQTISELAASEGASQPAGGERDVVTGPMMLPRTMIRHLDSFLRDYWNTASLLKVTGGIDPAVMERAVYHLLVHHDALRLRIVREVSGWRAFTLEPGAVNVPFTYVDLSALPAAQRGTAIESSANDLQSSLSLARGPLLRVAVFKLGAREPDRVLVIVNHHVSDDASFDILLEDLWAACVHLGRGEEVRLPPKTTSLARWAERVNAFARSAERPPELERLASLPWQEIPRLPLDHPEGRERATWASVQAVRVSLGASDTRILLRDLPRIRGAQMVDALTLGVAQALARWTGWRWMVIWLFNSGRDIPALGEDLDLSRTVGGFFEASPVIVEWAQPQSSGEALLAIREQVHFIPGWGSGYPLIRFLDDDEVGFVSQAVDAVDVALNYVGVARERARGEPAPFRPAQESVGSSHDPESRFWCVLDCTASVVGGRLVAEWRFSDRVLDRATVERVAGDFVRALEALVSSLPE
jgi:non-ribosomal peptide synthase protein (TIGR01720 family)